MSKLTSLDDAVKELLRSGKVSSQEEIVKTLESQGYEVNQSKISRLLRKIGAVKMTNEHKQIIYTLPLEPAPPTSKNILSQLITNITHNETLIVIHTNPGCASLIARLLDHHRQEFNLLGTVAGDDTLFIAPISIKKVASSAEKIRQFISKLHD